MDQLDAVLSEVVDGGTLLEIQPGGNHGDSLIYHGFNKYLERADFEVVGLDDGRFRFDAPRTKPSLNPVGTARWGYKQWQYARHRLTGDVSAVYIHGGGNFNDLWKVGIRSYLSAARYFDCPIVVGPQSCQFEETDPADVFRRAGNETHFFCREEYSYDIVREAAGKCGNVDVYLDDDTALFLEREDLPVRDHDEEHTLLAMRMDKDSRIPTIDRDVAGPIVVNDISKMESTYEEWVNAAARAERIFTDRLHVAILGAILEKPIVWYNTGYHKNQGVYEYSLANEPGVEFHY